MTGPAAPDQILEAMPYGPTMRLVDDILELGAERILTARTWTAIDCLDHFKDHPVVPGVRVIEFAAQSCLVAWGMYHASLELPLEEAILQRAVGLFTDIDEIRFSRILRPGDRTLCRGSFGEDGFYRDGRMVAYAEVTLTDGPEVGATIFRGWLGGKSLSIDEVRLVGL